MKTQQECLLALALGCTLQEKVKGFTVMLKNGKQFKSNRRRWSPNYDYRFNSPESWRVLHNTWRYRLLRNFV